MVYHRLDSSTSSSAAPQQLSETTSDIKEELGKSPFGLEGEGLMDEHNSWDGSEDKGPDCQKSKDVRVAERSRSRNGRDDRFSRSRARSRERHDRSRSRDRRDNFKERERSDDGKYDDSKHSERSRYRESSRYRDRSRSYERYDDMRYSDKNKYNEDKRCFDDEVHPDSRYSDDPRADEQRYSEGRYRGESSRFDDESRYSDSSRRYSRHKGDRGDDWYSESRSRYREGRRSGSSRYSDDDSRYGEGSRKWKDRDARSTDRESKTLSTSRPEKLQNMFQNDGSFLEMFKKMQEANKPPEVKEAEETLASDGVEGLSSVSAQDSNRGVSALKRPAISIVGKRRGGRVLPTGMVRKVKRTEEEEEQPPKDAWSLYMAEVKKYKESSCEEEGKMRPLVK